MKQYFPGSIAFLLALSLNSIPIHSRESLSIRKPIPLFWYRVDNAGKVIQILGHAERSTFIPVPCPDMGPIACMRGYFFDPALAIGDTAPTPSTDVIKRFP